MWAPMQVAVHTPRAGGGWHDLAEGKPDTHVCHRTVACRAWPYLPRLLAQPVKVNEAAAGVSSLVVVE